MRTADRFHHDRRKEMAAQLRWDRWLRRHHRAAALVGWFLSAVVVVMVLSMLEASTQTLARGMMVPLGLVWVSIVLANPLRWSPIRLRHAIRFLAGAAFAGYFPIIFAARYDASHGQIVALSCAALAGFVPVVAFCNWRKFTLKNAFDDF